MVHFPAENTHHAEAHPAGQWQPIATAPKTHGSLLLLATGRGVVAGSWGLGRYNYSTREYEHEWVEGVQNVIHPTHWMPLPAPPSP